MKRGDRRVTTTSKMAGQNKADRYWSLWAQAMPKLTVTVDRPSQIIHPKPSPPPKCRGEWCPVHRRKVCDGSN